jgi:hypothetical protein
LKPPPQPAGTNVFSCYTGFELMDSSAQRQKRRDIVLSSLDVAIDVMNLAKEVSSITPAKAVFGSASVILTMIKVCFFLHCLR